MGAPPLAPLGTVAKLKHRYLPVEAARELDPAYRELIRAVRRKRLTYLSANRLAVLAHTCDAIERQAVDGVMIEAGCALGGSAIVLASVKRQERPFAVHDVFGLIPPPTEEDGDDVQERYEVIRSGQSRGLGGDRYYGYEPELRAKVAASFDRFGLDRTDRRVSLVEGLVQETLRVDGPVALAHIDVDWYEPVRHCLGQIMPHLVVGGSVILDDYFDWSGCRRATDEYLDPTDARFRWDSEAGSLRITRTA